MIDGKFPGKKQPLFRSFARRHAGAAGLVVMLAVFLYGSPVFATDWFGEVYGSSIGPATQQSNDCKTAGKTRYVAYLRGIANGLTYSYFDICIYDDDFGLENDLLFRVFADTSEIPFSFPIAFYPGSQIELRVRFWLTCTTSCAVRGDPNGWDVAVRLAGKPDYMPVSSSACRMQYAVDAEGDSWVNLRMALEPHGTFLPVIGDPQYGCVDTVFSPTSVPGHSNTGLLVLVFGLIAAGCLVLKARRTDEIA